MSSIYNKKVVFSGNVIEIYEYSTPVLSDYVNKIEKFEREQTEDVKKENFIRSMKRTKRKIIQLVNTNFVPNKSSFLTLTFKDNIRDYDVAFNYWKRFKKKVEYHFDLKLTYLGVVEFQERGAIHFHICLFNVPILEQNKLYKLWNDFSNIDSFGGVNIKSLKDCDNIGAYLTYYMGKNFDDFYDNEFKCKKRYFKSRNLIEPSENFYNTFDSLDDSIEFNHLLNSIKDNIVFEYQTKPFTYKTDNVRLIDNETGEIKEELVDYTQSLKYKQIVLHKNNSFRK